MADTQIHKTDSGSAPLDYVVVDGAEFELKAVRVDYAGGAGIYLPVVSIISDSGLLVARAVDQTQSVAAGGSADVSFFPRLTRPTLPPPVTDCQLLGSGTADGVSITVTLSQPVPAAGLLEVMLIGSTVGDRTDTNSLPTSASDSKGVAGWHVNTLTGAELGAIREVNPFALNTTTIVYSVYRACTTGDLVAGDTITVGWFSQSPALFHQSALVVYVKGKDPAIAQDFGITYNQGDDDPGANPSLTLLSWYRDYGAAFDHWHGDGHMFWALGAYPAVAGVTGINGVKVGEIASGVNSLAAFCMNVTNGQVVPDPGGTWPAGASQILGNYQAATPLP